jgi:benzoylformate decarboxylase
MYSVQALWSAREENAPVLFLVLNNGAYNILKSFTMAFYPGRGVKGLDVTHLDLVQVAKGMVIHAERQTTPEAEEEAIPRALQMRQPVLLDVAIDPTVPSLL